MSNSTVTVWTRKSPHDAERCELRSHDPLNTSLKLFPWATRFWTNATQCKINFFLLLLGKLARTYLYIDLPTMHCAVCPTLTPMYLHTYTTCILLCMGINERWGRRRISRGKKLKYIFMQQKQQYSTRHGPSATTTDAPSKSLREIFLLLSRYCCFVGDYFVLVHGVQQSYYSIDRCSRSF